MEQRNPSTEPFAANCRDALIRLSDAASRHSDPKDLLGVLARQLRDFLQFDGISIVKYAEHEQETQWEVCEVRGASVPPARIPLEETLSKWVHDRQQPLSIPALQDDQRFPATTAWLQQHGLQCVCAVPLINVPTVDLAATVVRIGNSSGREVDKFSEFKLTATPGNRVRAPLIAECYANFECRLVDSSLVSKYSLFIFEVLAARVARAPKFPKTIHYRGSGLFMFSRPNREHVPQAIRSRSAIGQTSLFGEQPPKRNREMCQNLRQMLPGRGDLQWNADAQRCWRKSLIAF